MTWHREDQEILSVDAWMDDVTLENQEDLSAMRGRMTDISESGGSVRQIHERMT